MLQAGGVSSIPPHPMIPEIDQTPLPHEGGGLLETPSPSGSEQTPHPIFG